MSSTAALGDQLDPLDVWWPRGAGDALRQCAAEWMATADLLEGIASVLDAVAGTIIGHHQGDAATRFADVWATWSVPTGYLATTIADCRRLAVALNGFGTDVDVADRALLLAAEQALDEIVRALSAADVEAWVTWLRDNADGLRSDLSTRATQHGEPLAPVAVDRPPAGVRAPAVPVEVDPARIAWPDPGAPVDLSTVASSPADLGAGAGTGHPVPVVAPVPAPVILVSPPPPAPSSGSTGGASVDPAYGLVGAGTPGTTVVVVGNSGPVTVNIGGSLPSIAVAPPDPTALRVAPVPLRLPQRDLSHSLIVPAPDPGREPAVTRFARVSAPDPVGIPSPSEPPVLADVRMPVAVPVPSRVTPLLATPVARAAAGTSAVAAAGAAAATATKKVSNGFMPFMPMGGGAPGGDEGPEPRRRPTRYRPT